MSRRTYSDTFRRIAGELSRHRYGPDMLRAIAASERCTGDPDASAWDTAEALQYAALLFSAGQACPLYSALCRSRFRPGPFWRRPERGSEGSRLAADLIRILRR